MKEEKKVERALKKNTEEGTRKQPYHKPILGRVTLFADQVLAPCLPLGTCGQPIKS